MIVWSLFFYYKIKWMSSNVSTYEQSAIIVPVASFHS